MKFLHTFIGREISDNVKNTLQEQPARSGMYNWIFALQGSIEGFWHAKEHLEDFDVIQVNMSPKDMPIIPELNRLLKNSSTQLVLNNDYVCEYWGNFKIDPLQYEQMQRMGDMVFTTEPHQASNMIDGTFTMPHPSNTDALKHLGTNQQSNSLGYIFHWWAGKTQLPYMTMERAKKKFGFEKTTMFGYNKPYDEQSEWGNVLFDDIAPLMSFPQFAQYIQGQRLLYDPNPYHTYGRNGVELACWKKPIVGSNRVFSYNKLFPELTIDPYDRNDTFKKMELALGDVDDIMNRAYKDVEYFNYKNSVKRFKEALEISTARGGSDWYMKNG